MRILSSVIFFSFPFLPAGLGKWNYSCSNFGGKGQKMQGMNTRRDLVLAVRSLWGCWWTEAQCAMGAAIGCARNAVSAWTPAFGNAPFVMLMGKESCWFTPVVPWMPTGFVYLLLKQLMKQATGVMKMLAEVLVVMKWVGTLCYTSCSWYFPSCV